MSLAVVAPVAGLKLVPLTVTTVPAAPDAGVKPPIVGAPVVVTTKSCALVTVFPATRTVTLPVTAPEGTTAVIDVVDAATTVAATPLNATAFATIVGLNPVPAIATAVPTGPDEGETALSVIGAALTRSIVTMLPTAS